MMSASEQRELKAQVNGLEEKVAELEAFVQRIGNSLVQIAERSVEHTADIGLLKAQSILDHQPKLSIDPPKLIIPDRFRNN